jgi:hypothetical protein
MSAYALIVWLRVAAVVSLLAYDYFAVRSCYADEDAYFWLAWVGPQLIAATFTWDLYRAKRLETALVIVAGVVATVVLATYVVSNVGLSCSEGSGSSQARSPIACTHRQRSACASPASAAFAGTRSAPRGDGGVIDVR